MHAPRPLALKIITKPGNPHGQILPGYTPDHYESTYPDILPHIVERDYINIKLLSYNLDLHVLYFLHEIYMLNCSKQACNKQTAVLVVCIRPSSLYSIATVTLTIKIKMQHVAVADPGWGIWGKCPPPPPPPFKKLHTRSRYSNRAVNYSNNAVTMFMRQCSLPMKL